MATALRGEIWTIDFDPTRGHEQAGRRPALVVSDHVFNAGPAGLVIVLPVTTKAKGVRSHVAVRAPEGGLRKSRASSSARTSAPWPSSDWENAWAPFRRPRWKPSPCGCGF